MNGLRKLVFGFFIATVVLGVVALGVMMFYLDYLNATGKSPDDKAGEAAHVKPSTSKDPADWTKGDHVRLVGTYIETNPEGGAFLDSLEGKGAINKWIVLIKAGVVDIYCQTKERPAAPVFEKGQLISVSGDFQFRNGSVVVLSNCDVR